MATNDVTVRRAAALDSEVVGELRAGDHCTVDGQQHISRQGRVVERSRICAPLQGWVSTCVEIKQCVGCTRRFTKSFLGDDAAERSVKF